MLNPSAESNMELICVITNYGLGSKVLQIAKKSCIPGGTVFLGKGTVHNRLLEFLAIASDIRKEIVFLTADRKTAGAALQELNKELKLEKPDHGIAFTFAIHGIPTIRKNTESKQTESEDDAMYQSITVIVEKGKGEEVMDAATEAGSTGGTIINARGSGLHDTNKVFSMEIETEKEVVIIIADNAKAAAIADSIRKKLNLDDPDNGTLFLQNINSIYGLYK